MSKILKNLAVVGFFLTPLLILGMEPEPSTVKIQTSNAQEFDVPLDVAQTSVMFKGMIEDIKEETAIIPATITGQQFDLLLPAMLQLAQLHTTLPQASEEELAPQLQQIVTDLKSDGQSLNNQQLIEFITGANFLNVPLVEPALKALAERTLYKNEIQKLVDLQNKLKDLWDIHPAMRMFLFKHAGVSGVIESRDGKYLISWSYGEGTIKVWDKKTFMPINLRHPWVSEVIESANGNLISCSKEEGTIKIWDKNDLDAEPTPLHHPWVRGVIESLDGNNLISWSFIKGTIKVWDINNLQAKPITLQHHWVEGVIENRDGNLISWSIAEGTIKIWDKNNLQAEPITLKHPRVKAVIESRDGKNLISWSLEKGTIKIWDKTNLAAQPIILKHPGIKGVLESLDGNNLISWSWLEDTIKIWDKHNLDAEPITLQHLGVTVVIESKDGKNLISWPRVEGTIKIWDKNNLAAKPITLGHPDVSGVIESMDGNNLISWRGSIIQLWDKALFNPTPELIQLLLTVYFVSKGQKFELTTQELAEFKVAFNTLSPMIQRMLEKQAPAFIAAIKSAQK